MPYGYKVYFTERPRKRVLRWDPDSGRVEVLAGDPANTDPTQRLTDPYGIAFDQAGILWISDKLTHRVLRLVGGRVVEVKLRDVNGHRARRPESPPDFNSGAVLSPSSLFARPSGGILCAFFDDHTLYQIRSGGELDLVLGVVRNRAYSHQAPVESVPPSQAKELPICGPTGAVERDDGTIFFVERRTQVVREYHPARGLRSIFPLEKRKTCFSKSEPPPSGSLSDYYPPFPASLALDGQGSLFLCDPMHRAVLHLDLGGASFERRVLVDRPAGVHTELGPLQLAFGPDGTAWLADSATQSIRAYEIGSNGEWAQAGAVLDTIGGEPLQLGAGGMGLLAGP